MRRVQEGDRRGAVAFLEKAYAADPRPDYLLQLAEQFEQLGADDGDPRDLRLAIAHYRSCLAQEQNQAEAASLQKHLQLLEETLAAVDSRPNRTEPGHARTAPPARPARVPIAFATGTPDRLIVSAGGSSCEAPCTLHLPPGLNVVKTSGSEELRLGVYVPPAAGTVHLVRSGQRFFVPGVLLTVFGALTASSLWALSGACAPSDAVCQSTLQAVWPTLGGIAFFTGIGLLGYYGGHQVTSADVELSQTDAAPALRLASVALQPLHNGAGAGVGFSF
jgi:hypothetical protein